MTTTTLVATPDPAPFDIHAQPTWIALGIGKLRREYGDITVASVHSEFDDWVGRREYAWVNFTAGPYMFVGCIRRSDMGIVYCDERGPL